MSLDPAVRAALRHTLETAAPLTSGRALAQLPAPVQRIGLVRSGSAGMLREALERFRGITPLPALCVLGRAGDDVVLAQAWPGVCELFEVPGNRDYAWADLAGRPEVIEAFRGCSHLGLLCQSPSAAGYENIFEILVGCGAQTCFAAVTGGLLVEFDPRQDALRQASASLCQAIVAWVNAHERATPRLMPS